MINLLISFKEIKIELYFQNANFTMVTARNVVCSSEIPIEYIFPKNRLYLINVSDDEYKLNFNYYIKNYENELMKIKITKNSEENTPHWKKIQIESGNNKRKRYYSRLKREFPTILDLKTIQELNWIYKMKKDFSHSIYDSLREILDDQETIQDILEYNSLKNQINTCNQESSEN